MYFILPNIFILSYLKFMTIEIKIVRYVIKENNTYINISNSDNKKSR